jgi:hypothetical protein
MSVPLGEDLPTAIKLAVVVDNAQELALRTSLLRLASLTCEPIPMLLPFRSDGQLASWAAFHESCSV